MSDDYRSSVERLAELNSTEIFSNGRAEHAQIIFETFLKIAKKRVQIFCKNLSPDVFDSSVAESMGLALRKGVSVEILAQEEPCSGPVVDAIAAWRQQSLPISIFKAKTPEVQGLESNFTVMDRKAFRFEPDRSQQSAYACMNGPKQASKLEDFFFKMRAATE
jgi:hypothetical protein